MRFGRTTAKKIVTVGKLRRSQIVSGSGCGAIVDMSKESVIMAGTDFWKHQENQDFLVYEENLQKFLGVDFFVSPSVKGENDQDLPAFRFPHWLFCPKCRRLAHEKKFGFTEKPKCKACNKELVPSRFVVACEKGHLDDFPYEYWVHEGKKCTGNSELYFETQDNSSGLESIIIKCKTCKSRRSMAKSFSHETKFKCFGKRPWLNDQESTPCDQEMRTLQRGATNLYFAINASALSIPPWSKMVQGELRNHWKTLSSLLNDKNTFCIVVKSIGLDKKCNCDADYLYEQALLRDRHERTGKEKSWEEILEDEYKAFLIGHSDDDDGEFKIRTEEVPDSLKDYIDQIVLATKLREVLALRGFKRINPDFDDNDNESFCKVSKNYKNWLPGMEMKGEGIFIKLNENRLKDWENKNSDYYKLMEGRMQTSMFKRDNFSPRYVLLHSLSHLLIKQLIMQCGYATASIKERIYSTFIDGENSSEMCGILIYTATNDSEGSLGGLVRQGEKDRFETTFLQMLESASWCSSDPLCIHSKAQGVDSLNYASCHSCNLLPETSCEARNCFLDRAAIVGTFDNRDIGFFRELMDSASPEEL
ncbi:hypothetical protein SAMN03159341_101429 [Paenibacillus sp. 1_12]|uniref:DUF1998 domain-containing protein n=1 Tax=Paenibacillus sp. 1_12 TaxID=1566278 RepID=UPI0008E917A1|nr:DUF1998 domain-containing protein [Paenibacillus sp. 1_12]SFK75633.1 hypothetical protein SAMN03159341_101429 [Paenibacillus sp. 1_12]